MKRLAIFLMFAMLMLPGALGANSAPATTIERYHFIEITAAVLIAIVLTELFVKDKLLLKYVWNVALMVSFMAAAVTALLYFFRLQAIHGTVVTLHIELGLVAVWIGIYHALKRAGFYTKCTPWKRKKCLT